MLPRVIDLRGLHGTYETTSLMKGLRSFGLWSVEAVEPGTLIVLERTIENVLCKYLYVVLEAKPGFTGSNGDQFWSGKMESVPNRAPWTMERVAALVMYGVNSLADVPEASRSQVQAIVGAQQGVQEVVSDRLRHVTA